MKKYFVLGLLSLLLLSGCAEKITQNSSYSAPVFNKDGNVICVRGITEARYNTLDVKLGDTYREYFALMSQAGANEVVYTHDLTNDIPVSMTANPVNLQIAYGSGLRLGIINKLVLMNLPAGSYTGAERIELHVANVVAFDWDSTGTKIIYANRAGEIRQINVDGTADTLLTTEAATEISAKSGNRIFFICSDGKLSCVDATGANKLETGVAGLSNINVSHAATNEIYGKKGNTYVKVDVTNPASITETAVIASLTASSPMLAPSGDRIVYFDNASAADLGMWVEIIGGTRTKVK